MGKASNWLHAPDLESWSPHKTPLQWLTLKEAAVLAGVSEKVMRNLLVTRQIAHKREGRRGRGGVGVYLIPRSAVEEYNELKLIKPLIKPVPVSPPSKPIKVERRFLGPRKNSSFNSGD